MKYLLPILLLLVFVSCRTVRKTERESSKTVRIDSTIKRETVKLDTLKAKAESVTISVPLSKLKNDTVYARNGRANIQASEKDGIIYLKASCDSLEKIIVSKDTEIRELRMDNQFLQRDLQKQTQFIPWWAYILIGFAPCTLMGVIVCFYIFFKNFIWQKNVVAASLPNSHRQV